MRMPHIYSNIPNNIFYSVFTGETLRIDCSTIFFSDFLCKDQELVSKILRQGRQVQKSHSFSKKTLNKHQEDFLFLTIMLISHETNPLSRVLYILLFQEFCSNTRTTFWC